MSVNGVIVIMFKIKRLLELSPSLAIADFLAGVTAFLNAVPKIAPSLKTNYCFRTLLEIFTAAVSITAVLHMCLLATERYFAVFFPLKSRGWITDEKVNIYLGFTWLVAIIASGMPLFWLGKVMAHGKITKEYEKVLRKIEPTVFSGQHSSVYDDSSNVHSSYLYQDILENEEIAKIFTLARILSICSKYQNQQEDYYCEKKTKFCCPFC